MSYILDALRRADAERERGSVPNIHAHRLPILTDEVDPNKKTKLLVAAVVALSAVLAGTWIWNMLGRRPDAQPLELATAATQPVTTMPVPSPASPATEVNMPAENLPTIASPSQPSTMPPPLPPPTVQQPVVAAPLVPNAAPARVVAKALPPAIETSSDARIYALNELPINIRKALPALSFGGAMYSENPKNRMLIINGQIFHEGDKLGSELFLEQIKLKSAVLNFKNYRYGIDY